MSMRAVLALAPTVHLLAGSILGAVLGLGCSLIVKPRDDVERCGNVDDCPTPPDARYAAQCIVEDRDIDGVCVAEYRSDLNCNEMVYLESDPMGPYATAWNALAMAVRYDSGCNDPMYQGLKGCPGPCQGTLTLNAYGVCDDGSGQAAVQSKSAVVGQDVSDQFCRSFFCDETFVCNRSNTSSPTCTPCEVGGEIGKGGCGSLYMKNVLSCAYQSAQELQDNCAAPDSNTDAVSFGTCP